MKHTFILTLFAFVFIQCQESEEPVDLGPVIEAQAAIYAVSEIGDDTYSKSDRVIGSAHFSQQGDVVTLTINLTGMTPNSSNAVHIHNGTVNEPGRHWNRDSFIASCNKLSMGEPWARPFAGDVGNVPIDASGNGTLTIQTDLWSLNTGDEEDVLDRAIMVHADPEDFVLECDPTHSHIYPHLNDKIAGGTIELISDVEKKAQMTVTSFPDFTICN